MLRIGSFFCIQGASSHPISAESGKELPALYLLDIFADPICPWCYIGKTRLDRALARSPAKVFDITWHPFQLNPDMPPEGMDRREYLHRKFGSKENAVRAYTPIAEAAEDEGLHVDFSRIKRTPNTVNAHRLVKWAALENLDDLVVSALFDAYFCLGEDIGDVKALERIANRCGMDSNLVARLLAGAADIDETMERSEDARRRGINAVPLFIVANRHAVPGAQPSSLWDEVIAELTTK